MLIPETQRRTSAELDDRFNMFTGDREAKRSAFWVMLTLSALIAVSGVVAPNGRRSG